MVQPYKPLMPGDWPALENIIQELYRILDLDTTLTVITSDAVTVASDLVVAESNIVWMESDIDTNTSDIVVLKSDVAVNASDLLLVGVGGNDSEIQYNNGGVLGGDPTFTFNDTTKTVQMKRLLAGGVIE
jgi:hypothetical protein